MTFDPYAAAPAGSRCGTPHPDHPDHHCHRINWHAPHVVEFGDRRLLWLDTYTGSENEADLNLVNGLHRDELVAAIRKVRAERDRLRDSLAKVKAAHDKTRQILGADVETVEDAAARVVRERDNLRRVNGEWALVMSTLIDGLADRGIPARLGWSYTDTALAEIDRLRRGVDAIADRHTRLSLDSPVPHTLDGAPALPDFTEGTGSI